MPAPSDSTPSLVFIHGFLDGATVWYDTIAALGQRAASALCVDLPGMGSRAQETGPFTLDGLADDVARQVSGLERPVVIVGQSMGSLVAELVASRLPDRVRGLVLLTPVPLRGTRLPDEVMRDFRALGGNPAAQRQVRAQLSVNLTPQRLEKLGRIGDVMQPESTARLADLWNDGHPDGEQAARFRGPVLIVRGQGDPFVTEEMVATGIAPRFEAPSRATVGDAGHWPHVEQAEAFAKHLEDFLVALEARHDAAPKGWSQAFERKSATAFAEAIATDVVLEASVMTRPAVGAAAVKTIMGAASQIYESLAFTHQATDGPRTYLEWEARAFGGEALNGITILTRADDGKIARVAIHHRPLGAALKFSAELARRVGTELDPDLFFGAR